MAILLDMEGDISMLIEVDKTKKITYIWLTNEEQLDNSISNDIDTLISDFSHQKNKVVIFRSGKEDIVKLTSNLLSHNKNI